MIKTKKEFYEVMKFHFIIGGPHGLLNKYQRRFYVDMPALWEVKDLECPYVTYEDFVNSEKLKL